MQLVKKIFNYDISEGVKEIIEPFIEEYIRREGIDVEKVYYSVNDVSELVNDPDTKILQIKIESDDGTINETMSIQVMDIIIPTFLKELFTEYGECFTCNYVPKIVTKEEFEEILSENLY